MNNDNIHKIIEFIDFECTTDPLLVRPLLFTHRRFDNLFHKTQNNTKHDTILIITRIIGET